MQWRTVDIEQLQPAPYNPRKPLKPGTPGYRRLERSLKEFSLVQPLVWNEQTGNIVGGHQRLEILKNQGAKSVEVVVVSLSLAREKALNVALNNSQVGSDWDAEKLASVLTELRDLPEIDATLTGFDERDLRDLLMEPVPDLREEAAEQSPHVTVTLKIDAADWETVHVELDRWLARNPCEVHVRMPS